MTDSKTFYMAKSFLFKNLTHHKSNTYNYTKGCAKTFNPVGIMEEIKKNKGGRPTKYTDKMPQKLIDYFSVPLKEKKTIEQATASGKMVEVEIEEFTDPLFIESFCADHQISKPTFYLWVKEHAEFSNAFNQIKPLQARMLLVGAMKGGYNASISKLVLANCTDYREKVEVEHKGIELKLNYSLDDSSDK